MYYKDMMLNTPYVCCGCQCMPYATPIWFCFTIELMLANNVGKCKLR